MGIRGDASPHDIFSKTRFRDRDVHNLMGFDEGLVIVPVNSGPQPPFEQAVTEETEDYLVFQDEFGVKKKLNRREASTPEFVGWAVENRRDFERLVEERFNPDLASRVPENWRDIVRKHRNRVYPLTIGGYPFGFYGFMRYMMGEERLLYNLYDDPKLVRDMMSFFASFWIELWAQVLDEIDVDCANFWEDMSYKNGPLISPAMFREFMTPCYRRITGFLKERGVEVIVVDSDGNMDELIPLFLEAGLTGVLPIEARAGNDMVDIRRKYPRLHMSLACPLAAA
jgi:uroporphyrinogen decarboxylase